MFDRWANPFIVNEIGGACPCQAMGSFYGFPFYFRARHGDWTLNVVKPGQDPISDAPVYYAEGDDESYGFISSQDAMKILVEHWGQFQKQEIHLAGYAYEFKHLRAFKL